VFGAVTGSRFFLCILLCAGVGALASGMALQHHYQRDPSSFCNINATFDCDVVNRSAYSAILGIPVALVGLLAYLLMMGLVLFQREKAETPALVLFISSAGLIFSLYLTYVEAEVLRTWCILCLTSLLTICLIAVLSGFRVRADLRGTAR
jgi:vitamin-K-epoxide reductase (warfarin-sensitive)